MTTPFPNLFSPIKVGPFTLKNRIAVAPHGPMYGQGGVLTRQYVDYEIEKAKGGAGLIIMSCGLSDPDAGAWGGWGLLVSTWKRENIPWFQEVVAAAHEHDCRVVFQFGENALTTKMAVSAYPHTGAGGLWSREMTVADIKSMMEKYRRCAEVVHEGGLDGMEMHGHGDFFSDFFSPAINKRTDEYGAQSMENRIRFFREAAEVFRGVLGRDKILGARISVDDLLPGSLPLEEGVKVASAIADLGLLDYINVDTTIEPQVLHRMIAPMYADQGYELYASDAVKQAVKSIPIFTVGRIVDPAFAETIIADGRADVVTMARALIADPEFPNKAREGRAADIRPCLGDNQECSGRINQSLPMQCTVNPATGHETRWGIGKIQKSIRRRKIVVVGGGPAGMEVARVAADRGHEVSLYEQDDALGGQVLLAKRLPGRADIGKFLPWHRRQLDQLGVKVTLGVRADLATIQRELPDVVVLATGSHWDKSGYSGLDFQETPGSEQANVLSLTDVIEGAQTGGRVIVYDLNGFVQAPGVAELLAGQGKQVEIVTPFPKIGAPELDVTLQLPWIMSRLAVAEVTITPDTVVQSIKGSTVTVANVHSGRRREVTGVDNVVIVSGRVPDQSLHAAVAASGLEWRQIGDCDSPHNIGKAFRDAWNVAVAL